MWQKIQAEIAAHESTLEELKKSSRTFPPASPECRSPRGGTQLDALQVKIRGSHSEFKLEELVVFNYTLLLSACNLLGVLDQISKINSICFYMLSLGHKDD